MVRLHEVAKVVALALIGLVAVEATLWGFWSGNNAALGVVIAVLVTYATILSRLLMGEPNTLTTRLLTWTWKAIFENIWRTIALCILLLIACATMGYFTYDAWRLRLYGFITFNDKPVAEPVVVTLFTSTESREAQTSTSRFEFGLSHLEAKMPVHISAVSEHFRTPRLVEAKPGDIEIALERRQNLLVEVSNPKDSTFGPDHVKLVLKEAAPNGRSYTGTPDQFGIAYFEAWKDSSWQLTVIHDHTYISHPFTADHLPYTFHADLSKSDNSVWLSDTKELATTDVLKQVQLAQVRYSHRVLKALASAGPVVPDSIPGHDPRLISWLPNASRLLVKEGHLASYNDELRLPNWVAYTIEGQPKQLTRPRFLPDTDVPESVRADSVDYRWSGYDRGHMAPLSDMRFKGKQAVHDAFLMSAICPQTPTLNRETWWRIEEFGRRVVQRRGSLCVIAGPAFIPDKQSENVSFYVIGKNKIAVPTHFFRIHVIVVDGKLQTLSFLVPNQVSGNEDIKIFLTSIATIENATGLQFFRSVPASERSMLMTSIRPEGWPLQEEQPQDRAAVSTNSDQNEDAAP